MTEESSEDETEDAPGDDQQAPGDVPLSDLRREVEERRDRETGEDVEDLFSEMDVGEVDEDAVWEQLSASADESVYATGPAGAAADVSEDAASAGARDVTVVEKRLCQSCPHFADPPETACTHEGTTIDAEVDVDHFRVVDCPVVAERREMEASDFSADED